MSELFKFEWTAMTLMGPALAIMSLGALIIVTALLMEFVSKKREAAQLAYWKYGEAVVETKRYFYTALELARICQSIPPPSLEDSKPTIPRLKIPGDIW